MISRIQTGCWKKANIEMTYGDTVSVHDLRLGIRKEFRRLRLMQSGPQRICLYIHTWRTKCWTAYATMVPCWFGTTQSYIIHYMIPYAPNCELALPCTFRASIAVPRLPVFPRF